MTEPLSILTNITIILVLGLALTAAARKLKISSLLLLVLCGVALNKLGTETYSIEFNPVFLTSISLIALVMIVFDSCARFKIKELDEFSIMAIKTSLIWLVLNMVLMTFAVMYIFKDVSVLIALMFATLMTGTSPSSVLAMFKGSDNRLGKFLEVEALVNTPLIVIVPFIILGFIGEFGTLHVFSGILSNIGPFLQQFVAGIGAGILVGIIVFKMFRKQMSETMTPLITMTASLFTYILAENLGGNGVLGVTTLGLFFGNVFRKEQEQLTSYSTMFANTLIILVFILIGLSVDMPLTTGFLVKSLALFFIYLIIRFGAIMISFRDMKYKIKEKIFLALNAQKGIAVATIAFSLTTAVLANTRMVEGMLSAEIPFVALPGATDILALIIAFIVYSLIFSTIIQKVSKFFIGEIIVPQEDIVENKPKKRSSKKK